MTEVSLANGLAFGYYHNFVLLFARRLYNDQPEILIGPKDKQKVCDPEQIQLKLVIPQRLNQATHGEIGHLLKPDCLTHAEIRVAGKSRPLTLYARANVDDGHQLVDVPTTMHVMTKAINHRLKRDPNAQPDSNDTEWSDLERQEIGRFESALKRLVAQLETTGANEQWSKKVVPGQICTLEWPFN
jgi:hypothetical protein